MENFREALRDSILDSDTEDSYFSTLELGLDQRMNNNRGKEALRALTTIAVPIALPRKLKYLFFIACSLYSMQELCYVIYICESLIVLYL